MKKMILIVMGIVFLASSPFLVSCKKQEAPQKAEEAAGYGEEKAEEEAGGYGEEAEEEAGGYGEEAEEEAGGYGE